MQFYWILTSHIVSILPIGQCLWTFKNHKTYDSLLTFLHLAFTVFFSICYHTDDYSDIEAPLNSRPLWTISKIMTPYFSDGFSQSINDKAVCRTAPATPGQLITMVNIALYS